MKLNKFNLITRHYSKYTYYDLVIQSSFQHSLESFNSEKLNNLNQDDFQGNLQTLQTLEIYKIKKRCQEST